MAVLVSVITISNIVCLPLSRESHMYHKAISSRWRNSKEREHHKYLHGEELKWTKLCSDYGYYISVHKKLSG